MKSHTEKYRWSYKKDSPFSREQLDDLSSRLGTDEVLTSLLLQRGVDSYEKAKDFFRPSLDRLHSPFLMKDMDVAVRRIVQAIERGEKIFIYGDYDVDGTTAVALMYSFLRKKHDKLEIYVPDRYKEGYGISTRGIDRALEEGAKLMIALDCGIKAIDKATYARSKGLDLIICDHHLPGKTLPEAHAVLDPKREDCEYPYKELSGCGVGFKLVQALAEEWNIPFSGYEDLIDLLVVSIGADIVPVTGENRILAYYGLKRLNENPRPGFENLLPEKKIGKANITDVVFLIGPRINAAGRIDHGKLAVQLMTAATLGETQELAAKIEDHNTYRKELDRNITREALQDITNNGEAGSAATVVYNPEWHKGVIGIVASRLIETHHRPTVVFTRSSRGNDGDILAGSARSVPGFDLYDALEACADILEQFGGHTHAAGMTLHPDRYTEFKQRFEKVVAERLEEEMKTPVIDIDAVLKPEQITPRFFRILKQFAPFGPGNLAPVFESKKLRVDPRSRLVGNDGNHLKLVLRDGKSGEIFDGIAFNCLPEGEAGSKFAEDLKNKEIDVAYHLEENEWQGRVKLQMQIKDFRPSRH